MTEPAAKKAAKKVVRTPKAVVDVAQAAPVVARKKRAVPVKSAAVDSAAEEKAKRAKKEKIVKEKVVKEKIEKEKVVRDSFTMPKSDYAKLAVLKQKCLEAGVSVKKSELLRAGLLLLEAATGKRLLAAVAAVETVKTGRPAQP